MPTCPPPEHLRQFLEERLGAADAEAVARHIETCPACRRALDQLSADADSKNWRRLRDPEPRSGDEPRPDFLRRLEGALAPGSSLSRAALRTEPAPRAGPQGEGFPAVAGYEILERLGRGGIGVVYKARDLRLKRTVALKMLLTGVEAGAEERARLRAEAEAVARLQHPNIVQIHEIGEHDGCPFLVLEFVEGGSLARRIGSTPQPPAVAAGILETAARAMHYAHQHGVVHRDLKPGNILLQRTEDRGQKSESAGSSLPSDIRPLSSDLVPKVTDFGLAKRLDEASHTQTGQVLGTPSYMAPEQARGQSKAVGPATDVYALGAILYQMLTGRPPFQGVASVDTIMQVLHEEPVPPRRLQPAVPRDLETVCLKCLEKEPQKRYPSALELAEDLRRFRAGEPIKARPVGRFGQGLRWVRRNPAPAGLLAALVLVLAGGLAGVTWSYIGAEAARKSEALARRQEAEQRDRAELQLYYTRVALAERQWHANNVALAEHLLDQCLPAEGRPDRRGWEWHYLKRLCHSELKTVPAHRAAISGLAFSPDGRYLASSAGDRGFRNDPRTTRGELTLWNAETLERLGDCSGHAGRVDGVAFDRSSSRLASVSADNTARLWDVSTRKELDRFQINLNPFWRGAAPAFSPDGETLALPSAGELCLLNVATRAASVRPAEHTDWAGACAYSPDGALLAVCGAPRGGAGVVVIWDVRAQRERYRLPVWSFAAAFSPDGKILAVAHRSDVLLVNAATGREVLTLSGHDGAVYDLAWSPDRAPNGAPECRFLATVGADQTARIWDVKAGREHRVFRGHTGLIYRVAYHPGGRRIVTGDGAGLLKVWNVDQDQRVLELSTGRPPREPARDVAFTADGRGVRAARAEGPGVFWGWELKTGRRAFERRVPLPVLDEWPLQFLAFSADGRLCAGPDPRNLKIIRIWNVETGEQLLTLTGHQTGVRAVAFSPDGRRLASASGEKLSDAPRELFVWQLPEPGRGEAARIEFACEASVQSLAFSADGTRLVAGERGRLVPNERPTTDWPWVDGHISVWDTATGQRLHRWAGHVGPVQSVAVDPKGRWIASAGRAADQSVRVWNAETGELLHDLHGPYALTCVTFHPDGTRLAAAGYEGLVQLWDPATGMDVLTLRGPGPRIPEGVANDTRVVFSPDGTRLAVNSWTGPIHVWDARPWPANE